MNLSRGFSFSLSLLFFICYRNAIQLPLVEYMRMRGLKERKAARKGVLDAIKILNSIVYDCYDGVTNDKRWRGNISLCDSSGYIKNGVIYFDFSPAFYEQLKLSPMVVPIQALRVNANLHPNSFHFLRYIAANYRLNEGKDRQNTINISTLVGKTPTLPTFEEVSKSSRNYNIRIVQPTFRDLDALEGIKYGVQSVTGTEIVNPYELSYSDFITSKLIIDYSRWPKHEERVENRKKYAAKKRGSSLHKRA